MNKSVYMTMYIIHFLLNAKQKVETSCDAACIELITCQWLNGNESWSETTRLFCAPSVTTHTSNRPTAAWSRTTSCAGTTPSSASSSVRAARGPSHSTGCHTSTARKEALKSALSLLYHPFKKKNKSHLPCQSMCFQELRSV